VQDPDREPGHGVLLGGDEADDLVVGDLPGQVHVVSGRGSDGHRAIVDSDFDVGRCPSSRLDEGHSQSKVPVPRDTRTETVPSLTRHRWMVNVRSPATTNGSRAAIA